MDSVKEERPMFGMEQEYLFLDKDKLLCSVRIPREVGTDAKGYLEDRRPSSNCDPYVITAAIASDVLLDKEN
uniref:Glutamine synthetase n=1 Tax=Panagrolaimus davidi TaxID=227884 RepID=A0A914PXT1_9BILA